jgi:hypothetical protein
MKTTVKRESIVVLSLVMFTGCGFVRDLFGGKEREEEAHAPTPAEPVPQDKLLALVPRLQGWQRQPPEGKTTAAGERKITVAKASYHKQVEGKRLTVSIEIIDGNHVPSVYAPFAVFSHTKTGPDGVHTMRVEMGGYPGIEEWKTESGQVNLALLVARRFVVTLRGSGISQDTVRQYINAIDLQQLAAWAATENASAPPTGY